MRERLEQFKTSALAFFRTPRFGLLDLMLAAMVVVPVWTHTPVGALGLNVLGMVWEDAPPAPSLTSYFRTGPPDDVIAWALEELPSMEDPMFQIELGALPVPYRIAITRVFKTAKKGKLPDATVAQLDAYSDLPEAERLFALLDDLYEGDAEVAIEIAVIGADARNRAIARAATAGFEEPNPLASHRPFLSPAHGRLVDRYVSGTIALGTVLDITFPIAGKYRISSKYGSRFHPVYKKEMKHNGIDIAVPIGTPVLSAQSGKVLYTDEDSRNGKHISVVHANGVRTTYCHLDAFVAKKGAKVKKGEVIAKSGNTGRSTGPHVHYIVRINGKDIDPLKLHHRQRGS